MFKLPFAFSRHRAAQPGKGGAQPEAETRPGLIQLNDVSKIYKTPAGEFTALKNIDLQFQKGEFTSIMGKSGSGKSTLLNMIAGIDHPTRGVVQINGVEIHRLNESKLAVWRGRNLGIVFQFFQLMPTLTVLENTLLPMDYCNTFAHSERETRALELLELVGIADVAHKQPATLSGGQQQIAAIARALANDPPILVADEPTGNLDSRTAEHVLRIFAELAAAGKTVLIVTHDPGLARRTGRRVLISDGELIDETVARALPMLSHPLMLRITRQAVTRTYEPGAVIATSHAMDAGLYLVASGQVEIQHQNGHSEPKVIGRVAPGAGFGEPDLAAGLPCDLRFQAASTGPARLLLLGRDELRSLAAEVPAAERALQQTAIARCQRMQIESSEG